MFRELGQTFATELDESRLNHALAGWSKRLPALARFESIGALVAFFRGRSSDDEKSKVIVPLAELCRQGEDSAKLVIAELFMPSMRRALTRYRGGPLTSSELESEIAATFWDMVSTTTADTPKPLSRLGRRPGDRLRDLMERLRAREETELPVEELQELAERTPWPEPRGPRRPVLGEREARVLAEARDDGVITELEEQLITLTRIEGLSLEEAGIRLGDKRSVDTLGQARRRAEGRLGAWLHGKEPPPRREI